MFIRKRRANPHAAQTFRAQLRLTKIGIFVNGIGSFFHREELRVTRE
jgi:hypothetical protein